jgi:hypothetical protein
VNALQRHQQAAPPPQEVCLGERAVDCQCDPKLHWAVLLDPWTAGMAVRSCLGCGTVTCTVTRGDEGRYTGDSWQAYFKVPVTADALAWMAQWPRAKFTWQNGRWPMAAVLVGRDVVYLPANTRCSSVRELEKLEARLAAEQGSLSVGERLRQAGCPDMPHPPASIPEELHGFETIRQALQLQPESDLQRLMKFAQLGSPASGLAVDLLRQRADFPAILFQALRSGDRAWQSASIALARAHRPVDPKLTGVLIEILSSLSHEPLKDVPDRVVSCGRYEELLVLIADLKLDAPEMIAALRDLRRRLARHDSSLVEYTGIVLSELTGEPLPRRSTGFFLP